MSLPSKARFHLNDGTTVEAFINIGWIFDENNMPRAVRMSAEYAKLEDTQWHSVTAYGKTYTKTQLNEIILNKQRKK